MDSFFECPNPGGAGGGALGAANGSFELSELVSNTLLALGDSIGLDIAFPELSLGGELGSEPRGIKGEALDSFVVASVLKVGVGLETDPGTSFRGIVRAGLESESVRLGG